MYRLYVDEVGTDGLTHLEKDRHRYLSLTGVAMQVQSSTVELETKTNWIKSHILRHDPDDPVIFHRTDILGRKGPFKILNNPEICEIFDQSIIGLFNSIDYVVITAIIDKLALINKHNWKDKNPYTYLMDIIVEKYVNLLERKNSIGDIMPERRGKDKDKIIQEAFDNTLRNGTFHVRHDRIQSVLRGNHLKFRAKKDNIAGLQLCDLLAHPSHMFARELLKHDVNLGVFAKKIKPILFEKKYDRSPSGKILGYGIKFAS